MVVSYLNKIFFCKEFIDVFSIDVDVLLVYYVIFFRMNDYILFCVIR